MANRYSGLILLTAVLFAQLLLMAYQLRRQHDIPLMRGSVVYLVAPIQRSLNVILYSFRDVWEGYVSLRGTHRQNETLRRENDTLKIQNQRLREQAAQGQRLQVFFDLRQQIALPSVVAQVLGTSSSETAQIVMIDKGAKSGLKPDLPVMVPDGVVGKVLHVFPDTAQVLLVTDPYSGVATLLENSRVHGILKGRNKPLCTLAYVPNGEEVRPGQKVFTSGDDQIYPKGLPVGVVLDAKPGPEFQQVTVRPLAPLNRLEEVLVILQSGGEVGPLSVASGEAPASPSAASAAPQPLSPPPSLASPTLPGSLPVVTAPAVPASQPAAPPSASQTGATTAPIAPAPAAKPASAPPPNSPVPASPRAAAAAAAAPPSPASTTATPPPPKPIAPTTQGERPGQPPSAANAAVPSPPAAKPGPAETHPASASSPAPSPPVIPAQPPSSARPAPVPNPKPPSTPSGSTPAPPSP